MRLPDRVRAGPVRLLVNLKIILHDSLHIRISFFEAAIRIEGALALADVMLPEPGDNGLRWHMIEVKSLTGVKDYHRDDLAV